MKIRLDCSPLKSGERVCAAVSGGADSVALLLALREANAEKASLGVVLSAVHVHHGLRGGDADADEAFVRALCARVGVALTVERVDVAARQAAEREGVEEAARALRYAAFWRLMEAEKVDVVATAHTLDDQAETVVMKLLRGAWTEGIGGIAPVVRERSENRDQRTEIVQGLASTPLPAGKQILRSAQNDRSKKAADGAGRIVRPMLGVRRAEVEAFLRERGQAWCEDATNKDVTLTRNRVRHELMPVLRGFNPGVDVALARLAEIARDEEAFWQAEVERLLPQMVLPGRPVRGGGRAVSTGLGERMCAVEIERLRPLPAALQRRLLRAAARGLGCRLSADETAKLLGLAGLGSAAGKGGGQGEGRIGARLELSHGLRVERTARELRLAIENAPFVARERRGKTGKGRAGGE